MSLRGSTLQLASPVMSSTFISAVIASDFPFNAVGPHWLAHLPAGTDAKISIRVSANGKSWGAWIFAPVEELIAPQKEDGQPNPFAGDRAGALVFVAPASRFIQYKIELEGEARNSPQIERMTLQIINSTAGPDIGAYDKPNTAVPRLQAVMAVPKPAIYKRAEWGARPPSHSYDYTLAQRVAFHHTAGVSDFNVQNWEDCAARVRAIQAFHMDTNGWWDIGYNYLICRHGHIIQGREDDDDLTDVHGAHDSHNAGSMGVANLGYFHAPYNHQPTPEMLNALCRLFAWKCDERNIDPQGRSLYPAFGALCDHVYGHREVRSTACPGDILFARKQAIRDSVEGIIKGIPTAVEHPDNVPHSFTLLPAYPNPFKFLESNAGARLHITFYLPQPQALQVTVHTVTGQAMRVWPEQIWPGGLNRLAWDGKNSAGGAAPAGVYFVRVSGKTQIQQGKVLLVK